MKQILKCLCIILLTLSPAMVVLAGEPIIMNDVAVIKDGNPNDCKSNWSGTGPPVQVQSQTGYGMITTTVPGFLNCSGCAFDQPSGDCICKRCEETYN